MIEAELQSINNGQRMLNARLYKEGDDRAKAYLEDMVEQVLARYRKADGTSRCTPPHCLVGERVCCTQLRPLSCVLLLEAYPSKGLRQEMYQGNRDCEEWCFVMSVYTDKCR